MQTVNGNGSEMVKASGTTAQSKEGNGKQFVTKTQLKQERGWSEKAIETLLGQCDEEKCNPHYQCAPPMKLYLMDRILKAELSAEFIRFKEAKDKRSVSSKRVAAARREALINEIRVKPITIPRITGYRKVACQHYNELWSSRGRGDKSASTSDTAEFINRISVNYLRHVVSSYEEELMSVYRKTGACDARIVIRNAVLDAIARTYPELSCECDRQKCALSNEAA